MICMTTFICFAEEIILYSPRMISMGLVWTRLPGMIEGKIDPSVQKN